MKTGILGCGNIGRTHLNVIKKLSHDFELSLCDTRRENAEKLAAQFGIKDVYQSSDELLSKEKPDAVHILTPVSSHFDLAQKAIHQGCHVYIEKPVTETSAEYEKLFDLSKKQGRLLCAGYSALGMPVILKAKKEMESGKLGRLVSVHSDFMCSWPGNTIPYGDPEHWAYSLKGGVLQNMADHPASVVVDAMESVEQSDSYFCRRNVLPHDCPDFMHMVLKNQDQMGSFSLSLAHGAAHRQVQYFLEGGTIVADMSRQLMGIVRSQGPQNFIKKTTSGFGLGWKFGMGSVGNVFKVITGSLQRNPGIVHLIQNFYDAVQGKEVLLVKSHKVKNMVAALERAWAQVNKE